MLRVRIGGADRPDRAAPSRADAARRGRRPVHGRRPDGPLRRPLGRLRQRARHRGGHRDRRAEPAGRRRAARRDGGLRARLVPGSAGGGAVRCGIRRRPGPVRPLAGLGARLRAHGQAGGVDAERARTPAGGRRRAGRRRGPRAPRAGAARRRAHRDGPVRRRDGLGAPPHRGVGSRDRPAGRRRGQRLRLVRPRRRFRDHRGARHPCLDAGDQSARRRRRPDGRARRRRPGARLGAGSGAGPARAAAHPRAGGSDRRARRRHDRRRARST